jgi:hypothetical protein
MGHITGAKPATTAFRMVEVKRSTLSSATFNKAILLTLTTKNASGMY